MRIAQVADFHFTHLTWNPLRLCSKRIVGNLNWLLFRNKQFVEEQLELLPALFQEMGVDWVLIGGDFTTTALMEEFEKAKQFVDKIQQPWIAVPGNHDNYTWLSYQQKHFYRYFTNKRTNNFHLTANLQLKDHGIEVYPLQEEWWLVALDTSLATPPYSSQGFFSEQLERHLEEVLQQIPSSAPILLLNHFPFFQNDIPQHNLKRGEALEKLLRRSPQIRLYLHGHTHRHIVADLQANSLPIVLDSGSCTQRKKGSWNLIDLQADGCSVSTYRWNRKWIQTRTESFAWTRK